MKVGIYYLYIHSKLYKWKGKEISESEFRWSLSKVAGNIPKRILPLIEKEMEICGLIKKNKRNQIILVEPMFNEDDCNLYYEKLKIF